MNRQSLSSHTPADQGTPEGQPVRPVRIGISRCLLGEQVRYDGGHKREAFLVEVLGRFVEWVPICPEVEAGFGTPREPMRLMGDPQDPRLTTIRTGIDHTVRMTRFANRRVRELADLDLAGYVFKKDSPSCGVQGVRVYNQEGTLSGRSKGLFAQSFQQHFPLIPVEEEDRLRNLSLRESFIDRVLGYHRWRALTRGRATRGALAAFHAQHKYLVLAHSPAHYQELEPLVASAKDVNPRQSALRYGQLFMEALKVKATVHKHVKVLKHLAGLLKGHLSRIEWEELQEAISEYRRGVTSLAVPLNSIADYARVKEFAYLKNQAYLNPPPEELTLRNHA
ncbi:MAG: DUF1722 domain-containing protein [Nitrospinae bacterium]|nr:DUF1722 domain-containing protein [Nitrospinota bacterium]